MYSIGQLSKLTKVKVPTIRYYEKIELLPKPIRSQGNQRCYSQSELDCLNFIKHARDLGLPIDSIRELIALSNHPEQPCAKADEVAKDHLAQIRERIKMLRKLENELVRITSECHTNRVSDCYVIQSFANHGLCKEGHDSKSK